MRISWPPGGGSHRRMRVPRPPGGAGPRRLRIPDRPAERVLGACVFSGCPAKRVLGACVFPTRPRSGPSAHACSRPPGGAGSPRLRDLAPPPSGIGARGGAGRGGAPACSPGALLGARRMRTPRPMAAVLDLRASRQLRMILSALKAGSRVPRAGRAAAFGSSVTSAKVAVNGVHLHYQQTGEGEHAVLLLPGMLGSGETDFGPQIKNLNKKLFTVVAWDPRGYGHSRPPDRDFPMDFFERDAKDAVDLMKTLNFKKVSLLGWSDGGITALIAAAKYPLYINKMVIWGANAYVTDEDEKIYQGIRDVSKWSEKTREPLKTLYGYDYFAKTCEKWVDGIQQFKHLPDGNICRHLLPLVQCPTLIVHGEKDPLVPRPHADFIHKHVKGSRLHLMPEGKHNLHLRFADEFNKLVEDFLQ